jgi:RHS repeat-associated protein
MYDCSHKFTGKERDSESGLDHFGARHYASTVGRFMVPDWEAKPTDVPYATFANPQSLNLYSYVQNNPTTLGDPDGHVAGVDDAGYVVVGGLVVFTAAVIIYESQPEQERNFARATSQAFDATISTFSGLFSSKDAEAGQLHAAGRDAIDKANDTIEKASHAIDSYENRKDVERHIDKLKEGVAQVGELSKQLDKTKGKTARDKVKAELKAAIKDVNGHEKDLRDKPKIKKTKDE